LRKTEPRNPKDFITELNQRNVYKVAIAYAVVVLLAMQIARQVFQFLEIPNGAMRLVLIGGLIDSIR
jgi:hypothetical protein